MECHPDRLPVDAPAEARAAAEARFKAVGEALDVLSDPLKKQLYDEARCEYFFILSERSTHVRSLPSPGL